MTSALLMVMFAAYGAAVSSIAGVPAVSLLSDAEAVAGEGADGEAPLLHLFPLEGKGTASPAVIVCPGGGYSGLAMDYEGVDVARWLNSHGIAAFVLEYRVAPHRHPVPLHDAQRALRMVRAQAEAWGVDPARLGILGFSAGARCMGMVMRSSQSAVRLEVSPFPSLPRRIALRGAGRISPKGVESAERWVA